MSKRPIRWPPPPELIGLHKIHEEYRQLHRSGLLPEWLCYEVGNKITMLPEDKIGYQAHMPVCRPGTQDGIGFGWDSCDFLLVLPSPSPEDRVFQTCLANTSGAFLFEELMRAGIRADDCLVTHAVRFALPTGATSFGQRHKMANYPYVKTDAFACNPKAIICFGADAMKSLYGKDTKLDSWRGSVHEWNGIPVIPTCSPSTFATSLGGIDVFREELHRAVQVTMNTWHQIKPSEMLPGYKVLSTATAVEDLVDELIAKDYRKLCIDTEFGNTNAREEFNKLRSFQVCWAPGQAAYIHLRGIGMADLHSPEDYQRIKVALSRLCNRAEVQLGGQHLRIDCDMPEREGMDWTEKLTTSFDTMLANHLLRGGGGDEGMGLDQLQRRYAAEFGAYWKDLEDWLDAHERKACLRFGYALIPDEILIPYALKDVDVNFRAWVELEKELAAQPALETLFRNIVMPCSLALLHQERPGILIDRERIKLLREKWYQPEYEAILAEFRAEIGWEGFNPNSVHQKRTFLFGVRDAPRPVYKDQKAAPETAVLLGLMPLYNTEKYPREWSTIIEADEQHLHSPSAKAATLDLMYEHLKQSPEFASDEELQHKAALVRKLKQLSVLGKFLTTYLSEPTINEFGVAESGRNIADNMWSDGRVRGHLHQTSETGRWRMSAANLQTNPKKQEESAFEVFVQRRFDERMTLEEYRERCNDGSDPKRPAKYPPEQQIPKDKQLDIPTFKSCYMVPKGRVFIEVDFKTAELCVLAFASGDTTLTKIIEQGRDLHAETACRAFRLPMLVDLEKALAAMAAAKTDDEKAAAKKVYKAWNERIKEDYTSLRTAAKTVVFGLMYGRGANALSREISKTGKPMSPEECQQIIDGFAAAYPKAWAWLQANMESAIERGYVETPFGRRRYFHGIQDKGQREQAAARREASNSPIQGCVADLLAVAAINLDRYRRHTEHGKQLDFDVMLPVHDAFWVECPADKVDEVIAVIRLCMSELNKVPGTPKHLGLDVIVFPHRFGEGELKPDSAGHVDLPMMDDENPFADEDDDDESEAA